MPHDIPRAHQPSTCRDRRRRSGRAWRPLGCRAERGHDVVAARGRCRGPAGRSVWRHATRAARTCWGSSSGATAELARLGVDVRVDTYADEHIVGDLQPDVVIVATGGLPQNPALESGDDLVVSAWDVVGGDARLSGDVLLYDDDGTHSAMTTAEMLARSGARLEIVTPERTVGVDVGGLNMVPYARAFNETDTRITLNQRVRTVRRDGGRLVVEIGSDHSPVRHTRTVDAVVVDHGVLANDELYFALAEGLEQRRRGRLRRRCSPAGRSRSHGDGYQLFRIGDAVAGRNIHAAIYDALRLCKDL